MPKFTPAGLNTYIQHLPPASETAAVQVIEISNALPAVVSVDPTEILKFEDGDVVTISGAATTGDTAVVNGAKVIANVDADAGTFELTDVDLSALTDPLDGSGITVTPQQGSAPAVNIVSLTNENPVVMTVSAEDITYFTNGEIVVIDGTDTDLDGRAFIAMNVGTPANTVTLRGADLSMNTIPVANKGTAQPITTEDFDLFCLSSMEYEKAAADVIDVSTFCGTESLAGTPEPGTLTVEGYIDFKVAAYNEWREAVNDGRRRVWRVDIPTQGGGGTILYVITCSGYTESYAVGEGASFTGEAVVNETPLYLV